MKDREPETRINPVAEKLLHVLKKLKRPGSFCTSGSVPAVLPGLDIANVGTVGFPLAAKQAEPIIAQCQQAPYGRGAETIVDTAVRKVWELNPDRFALTNPDWEQFLSATIRTVQNDLGLEKQKLESHLYKLLLYEPGGFFLPHRDGERLDRMVATLVIVLPSSLEGGELVVRHEGAERVIDYSAGDANPFHTHFAAFYADCEHEVRPLTRGYRLCLVYNLTLGEAKKPPTAPPVAKHIAELAQILTDWARRDDSRKLAIALEHQYSQKSLAWDALKGVDRTRARSLAEAARAAGCHVHLALLTRWESGDAEDDGYGSSYSGYGRRNWAHHDPDDDLDDVDEEHEGRTRPKHRMMEVYDSSLTADHWRDPNGGQPKLGEMRIEPEEIVPPDALAKVTPEERFGGYTGNEGAPLEHWYRRAAIVVWPKARHFAVLCDCGAENALQSLAAMVAGSKALPAEEAATVLHECRTFARSILANWAERDSLKDYRRTSTDLDLLKSLAPLDDPTLIASYLKAVAEDAALEPGAQLPPLCEKYGWATFENELAAIFAGTKANTLERNIRILESLAEAKTRKKTQRNQVVGRLAGHLVSALATLEGATTSLGDWVYQRTDRSALLAALVRTVIAVESFEILTRLTAHVQAVPKKYPLETQIATIASLKPWLKKNLKQPRAALETWIDSCCRQLESLTASLPTEPSDLRRSAELRCACADCTELKRFLADPSIAEFRFRAGESRRRHLESTIHTNKCDVKHMTDKRGSPHTLVCAKTKASYEASVKTHGENLKHLASLLSIRANLPGTN